jgi:membrane protease YdiL (CAAX protease family)
MARIQIQELPKELDLQRRSVLKVEVLVVLCIAAAPDLANAILSHFVDWPDGTLALETAGWLDRSLRVGAAVLYLMWRSGESWATFGLKRVRWTDPLVGLLLYLTAMMSVFALYMGSGIEYGFTAAPQVAEGFALPADPLDWALLGVGSIANGFVEEIAITAFLLTRLERLWGSTLVALLATVLVAASYHLYAGVEGVVNAFLAFTVHTLWFVATRRLWPAIFAHMFADFLPFLFW